MAIVNMSINAMKFEEITVTFHPIKPNKPIIIITEAEHPNKGKVTHLKFLKINHSVKIIKNFLKSMKNIKIYIMLEIIKILMKLET